MYSFLLIKSKKKKKDVINRYIEVIYTLLTHYFELNRKTNYCNTLNIGWSVIKTEEPIKHKLFYII